MFHANVFRRNHLAVEHYVLGAVLLVVALHYTEHSLHKIKIIWIVIYLKPHKLGGFHKSVHSDSKILPAHVYISGIKERQHLVILQVLQILIVCELHLMAQIHHLTEKLFIV